MPGRRLTRLAADNRQLGLSQLKPDPLGRMRGASWLYFFDAESLADDLASSRVSSRDIAIYIFLCVGIAIPIWYPVAIPSAEEAGLTSSLKRNKL